jgi:hypothetical protein
MHYVYIVEVSSYAGAMQKYIASLTQIHPHRPFLHDKVDANSHGTIRSTFMYQQQQLNSDDT